MVTFTIWACAAVGAVVLTAALLIVLAFAVSAAACRIRSLATAPTRKGRDLADMPGHPECVRWLGDRVADEAFWDTAQELLDDPAEPRLADVCEALGWLR